MPERYRIRLGGGAPPGCKARLTFGPGMLSVLEDRIALSWKCEKSRGIWFVLDLVSLLFGRVPFNESLEDVRGNVNPSNGDAVVDEKTGKMSLQLSDGRWCTFRVARAPGREQPGQGKKGSPFARLHGRLKSLYGPRLRHERLPRLTRFQKCFIAVVVLAMACAAIVILLNTLSRPTQ